MSEFKTTDEYTKVVNEYSSGVEFNTPPAEFSDYHKSKKDAASNESKTHKFLKKMVYLTTSAVATAATIFASYGYDPLAGESYDHHDVYDEPDSEDETESDKYLDSFPKLPNLLPDWDGDYAWGDTGSELYVRIVPEGGEHYEYLVLGEAWSYYGYYDDNGDFVANTETMLDGATYDKDTNTLTLENFSADVLDINLMGNGFKIELIGENHIGQIISWGAMYGGSITFTGSGSLVVNENLDYTEGVKLNAETSKSAIMFDRYADVLIYGGETPILVNDSLLSKTVYYLSPITEEDGLNYVHYK